MGHIDGPRAVIIAARPAGTGALGLDSLAADYGARVPSNRRWATESGPRVA